MVAPPRRPCLSRDRISGSETYPQFHRWPVPAALLGTIPSEPQPGDGAGHRRNPGKRPRRRRCRSRRGVPRVRVVAPDTRRRTIPALDPGCRAHRGELRRAGAARIGRQRKTDRARPPGRRAPSHPELSLLCDGDPARRNALPYDGRSGAQLHHPEAPRGRRADLTLEPAAVPSDLEDRSGHRRRELLRGEAFGADTADRRPARRTDRGGGHSARRGQHRARPRRERRPRPHVASERPTHLVHRGNENGRGRDGPRGTAFQESVPGARREEPEHRVRGRRSRAGRPHVDSVELRQPGGDLPLRIAPVRRENRSTKSSSTAFWRERRSSGSEIRRTLRPTWARS